MFSKSLFKQSCKANGTMWAIITFAVCFMLTCVMTIAGGSSLTETKNAIENTIIKGELESQIQTRAVNYYNFSNDGLLHFDETFKQKVDEKSQTEESKALYQSTYQAAITAGDSDEIAKSKASAAVLLSIKNVVYSETCEDYTKYIDKVLNRENIVPLTPAGIEIKGVMLATLNPTTDGENYLFDEMYTSHDEIPARYDLMGILTQSPEDRNVYRDDYVAKNSSIVLAANLITDENIRLILTSLSNYGVTLETYKEFGFADYSNVKEISATSLVNYRANFIYRIENMKPGETVESIKAELLTETAQSLLASLPKEVSEALNEIGQADLYGGLVGSIFFKMAGLLLPMIYMIMAANNLIAGQVDSGSMAYVLSSSVKRRTVVCTQAIFLVGSLFAMFGCTTITSLICLACVHVETGLTYGKLVLINLGAFMVMFAMSGISFLASCWFNRSKRSMAIGGGINMFFLVASMIGLFGSSVLPSIIRMKALNSFNYVSIISLFDVVNILDGGLDFLWKFAILIGIGVVCYVIGSEKFCRKDLPL